MPYPEKPRQPDQEGRGQDNAPAPVYTSPLPANTEQATAGAPRIPPGSRAVYTYRGNGEYTTMEGNRERTLDFNRRIPTAAGTGGPENWDNPRRRMTDYNARYATASPPHPFNAEEVMNDYPQAVARLRDMLNERRAKLSDTQIAKSDFWRKFDTMGQAFVAELLANVMGLLTADQRVSEAEQLIELTPGQQDWVRTHPLTRWLEWM